VSVANIDGFRKTTLGTRIGFKSLGTCGSVYITIGATMLGYTHPISSGDEAKALSCLEHILFLFIQEYIPPPIFNLAIVSSINLCSIFLASLILGPFLGYRT
jgi:hypothetical protein